jgi:hypothetical protein
MNTITRNPDVRLHLGEKIPAGYYLHSRDDSRYAKMTKIPFGYCESRVITPGGRGKVVRIGLVISVTDRARMDQAAALRGTLSKKHK